MSAKAKSQLSTHEANDLKLLEQSQTEWVESLSCVYRSLRNNMCPYFYVCTRQFTALFSAPKIRGSTEFTAVLSQSTASIRKALEDEAIPFEMPLAPTFAQDRAKAKEKQRELEELQTQLGVNLQSMLKRKTIDFKPQSMLSFHGHEGVYGLYEFLCNWKFARK